MRLHNLSVAGREWRARARVHQYQAAPLGLPLQHRQRDILRVDLALEQDVVDQFQELARAAAAMRQGSQKAADQGPVERGRGALAADIAEGQYREITVFE